MLQASAAELLVYMGLWVPWPLTQPAILIRALGMDLLASEGAVIVSMQDLGDVLPVRRRLLSWGFGCVCLPVRLSACRCRTWGT